MRDLVASNLHVRAFGAGPPLLLIHGLGSSGDDWAFQVGPLAQRHRLIVPDLRGCGLSRLDASNVSIEGFADDLWQLIDSLGLDAIDVTGFSMGGAVALEMALQRPGAVPRLALINSLPTYRVDHWRKAMELYVQIGMVRLLGMRRTAALAARRLFPHPQQAAMRQRVIDVVGGSDPQPYLRCARALADWCAAERLDALRSQVLMIAGEHDYTGLAEKRRWALLLSAELAVVNGSRHGTPFDSIQATNRCLLDFFAGLPVPSELQLDQAQEVPKGPPELPPELPMFAPNLKQPRAHPINSENRGHPLASIP